MLYNVINIDNNSHKTIGKGKGKIYLHEGLKISTSYTSV